MKKIFIQRTTVFPGYEELWNKLFLSSVGNTGKLLYMVLLEEIRKNGREDSLGNFYVEISLEELSDRMWVSTMTIKRALRDLEMSGYIRRTRDRIGAVNHIYLLLPTE